MLMTLKFYYEFDFLRRMPIPPAAETYNFSNRQLADATLNIDPSGGQSQAVKAILAAFVIFY